VLATVYIQHYENFVTGLSSRVCLLITVLKFKLLSAYTNRNDGSLQLQCVAVAGLYTASTQDGLRCGAAVGGVLSFWAQIPPTEGFEPTISGHRGSLSVVSVVCCQVGLYDGLIIRPEDSYRVWCV
jgi:hypothetical protein